MRKTIYVPNEFDWGELEGRALESGLSVSRFLLGYRNVSSDKVVLARIESKLDLLIQKGMPKSLSEGRLTPEMEDASILAAGQAKLDEVRKKRDIKGDKIESLTGFSGPRPKKGIN